MLPIRTILHATDFSTHSRYAFQMACALARDYEARLVVVHVLTPPVVIYGEGFVPADPEEYQDQAREKLEHMAAREPSIHVEQRLVEGDAATEIMRVSKEIGSDLIVMGTHGRTGLGRFFMGSVSEQVLRRSTCPVLTVKQPFVEATALDEQTLEHAGRSV